MKKEIIESRIFKKKMKATKKRIKKELWSKLHYSDDYTIVVDINDDDLILLTLIDMLRENDIDVIDTHKLPYEKLNMFTAMKVYLAERGYISRRIYLIDRSTGKELKLPEKEARKELHKKRIRCIDPDSRICIYYAVILKADKEVEKEPCEYESATIISEIVDKISLEIYDTTYSKETVAKFENDCEGLVKSKCLNEDAEILCNYDIDTFDYDNKDRYVYIDSHENISMNVYQCVSCAERTIGSILKSYPLTSALTSPDDIDDWVLKDLSLPAFVLLYVSSNGCIAGDKFSIEHKDAFDVTLFILNFITNVKLTKPNRINDLVYAVTDPTGIEIDYSCKFFNNPSEDNLIVETEQIKRDISGDESSHITLPDLKQLIEKEIYKSLYNIKRSEYVTKMHEDFNLLETGKNFINPNAVFLFKDDFYDDRNILRPEASVYSLGEMNEKHTVNIGELIKYHGVVVGDIFRHLEEIEGFDMSADDELDIGPVEYGTEFIKNLSVIPFVIMLVCNHDCGYNKYDDETITNVKCYLKDRGVISLN